MEIVFIFVGCVVGAYALVAFFESDFGKQHVPKPIRRFTWVFVILMAALWTPFGGGIWIGFCDAVGIDHPFRVFVVLALLVATINAWTIKEEELDKP